MRPSAREGWRFFLCPIVTRCKQFVGIVETKPHSNMEKPRVLVAITSYNRKQTLQRLIGTLYDSENTDVVVFDDKSDYDAKEACKIFKHVTVITSPEHRGKAGFWKVFQDIFDYCKEHEYDYYIILPDDVEPCPDFVNKAIQAFDESGCICLSPFLTNRSLLPGISRWGNKPIQRKPWGYLTNYFDCCGIMRLEFFEALNWKMLEILPSADPYRSSGVGRQITTRLQAANKPMGHVHRTLLSTTDDPSSMNPEERKRHPMYADWRDNVSCVDVHMAALWRGGHVVQTAESLLQQVELATLYITLNNFSEEQDAQVRGQLKLLAQMYGKKVVIRKGTNKKGSNEKLSQLSKSTAPYIAFADDDIIYPSDYLFRLIGGCNVRNAAVSFHGGVLREWPLKKYYDGGRDMKSWNISLERDTRVDILGTGVCLLKTIWFTEDELRDLYKNAPTISMDDIYLSCILAQKGIERFVLEHPSRCISIKKPEEGDGYVYDKYRDNDKAQVEWINAHYPQEALVRNSPK